MAEEPEEVTEDEPVPSEGHELADPDRWEPDYEPVIDRLGTQRRVLGWITDEEHMGRPRNTVAVLQEDLRDDPNTNYDGDIDTLDGYLDELEEAGLIARRDDDTLEVTDAGRVELAN